MSDDLKSATFMPGRGPLAEVDVSDIDEDGVARTFEYTDVLGQESEGFIMRWRDGWRAFENRCPHWSIPLGFDDESFVDLAGDIICPMHGARFKPDTGECSEGPCVGDGLEQFDVEVRDGIAFIHRRGARLRLI